MSSNADHPPPQHLQAFPGTGPDGIKPGLSLTEIPNFERPSRIPELDSLRGLGALMILGCHLWPTTFFFGWTRVDFFFVLSGHLVTSNILRFRSDFRPLPAFWFRRAFRILPAYYMMLVVAGIAAFKASSPRFDSVISYLILAQDIPYYWSERPQHLPGTLQIWSLAVEVQFYLVWPLVTGLVGRTGLVLLSLGCAADAVAARILGMYPMLALARCDGLALGSLLALILEAAKRFTLCSRAVNFALSAIGLSGLCFFLTPSLPFDPPIPSVRECTSLSLLAINLIYASLIGLIVRCSGHRVLTPLRSRSLRYLGTISYGVYLYHMIIINCVKCYALPVVLADTAIVILSVLAAIASWKFVENPCMALAKRYA